MVDFYSLASFSWLILLFPLAGFLITGIGGRLWKGHSAGIIASLAVLFSFLFVSLLFLLQRPITSPSVTLDLGNWISVGKFVVAAEFLIDPLSVTMMLVVTGVGFLIHLFSIGYMAEDERFAAFFSQLNLFTFSMLLLVMGANYLIVFVGWEGVGLCSYLLIGFWYRNNAFNLAARKAFVMNRIGDLGFLLGMILLFFTFQTLSFGQIFSQAADFPQGNTAITIATLLLLVGALGKSAQIPLYTWLPDAMAGPTPVSALIHAATMVTAGVYLIARSSQLFVLAPLTLNIIVIIGISTALLGALIGLFQNDIKKILAYSTISQLGYMFLALGVGAFSSGIFHLTTHAFFKALLFLAAGSIIHALHGEQDIRNMGGLRKVMPLTFWTFLVATLAIAGLPPFSGFFSKDEILMHTFEYNPAVYLLALLGALLTCFYMFRLLFLTFFGNFRGQTAPGHPPHESPPVMTIPLIILAILSFFGGWLNVPLLFGGKEAMTSYLWPSVGTLETMNLSSLDHAREWQIIILSVIFLALTIILAWYIFVRKGRLPLPEGAALPFMQKLLTRKFYVDEIYDWLFVRPYEWLSAFLFTRLEKGLIDPVINGTGVLMLMLGNRVRKIQSGGIGFYLFAMASGILAFLLINLILS